MASIDPPLQFSEDDVVLVRDADFSAASRSAYYRALRRGELTAVRPGAAMETSLWNSLSDRDKYLAEVLALGRTSSLPLVFSHTTAALLLGFRLASLPRRIHVSAESRRSHSSPRVLGHRTLVEGPPSSTGLPGIVCSRPAAMVVECLTTLPYAEGLVLADQVLRRHGEWGRVPELLESLGSRRGTMIARRVLDDSDGGAESVLESLTRAVLVRGRIPRPVLQMEVATGRGTKRLDMVWKEKKLALEVDGRSKYFDYRPTEEVIYREHRREQALKNEGWTVQRTDAAEVLHRPAELVRRIRACLDQLPRAGIVSPEAE